MKLSRKALFAAIGALSLLSADLAAASVDSQFRSAVARVLNSVKDEVEFLRELSSSEFRDFVSCAQNIMDSAPLARKQYVLAASDRSEQRQRFDEVALDNRAKLKQQIARECG
jgi:hypothetical protein